MVAVEVAPDFDQLPDLELEVDIPEYVEKQVDLVAFLCVKLPEVDLLLLKVFPNFITVIIILSILSKKRNGTASGPRSRH
jgi:hypothetical protein